MQQEMKNDYRSIMEEFSSEGLEQFHKDDMPLGDVWQVVRFISSKQDIPVDYQFDVFLKIREKMIEEKIIEVDDRLIHTIKKLKNPMVLKIGRASSRERMENTIEKRTEKERSV